MKLSNAPLQRRVGAAATLPLPRRSVSPASAPASLAHVLTRHPSNAAHPASPTAPDTAHTRRTTRIATLMATIAAFLLLRSTLPGASPPTLTLRPTLPAAPVDPPAGRQLLAAQNESAPAAPASTDVPDAPAEAVTRDADKAQQPEPAQKARPNDGAETLEQNTARDEPVAAADQVKRDEEAPRPAKIAFFIQVSKSSLPLLPRLMDRIHHADNLYAVHFDAKLGNAPVKQFRARMSANARFANVRVMPSELITYRGVTMLLNTINAMGALLDIGEWDYFINLSGADYPLITPAHMREILGIHLGLNFFTFAPRRTWDAMAESRLSQLWFDEGLSFRANASLGELTKVVARNPIVDARAFDVAHAEAWCILSRDFARHVVRADDARKMLLAFSYSADASEHYLASLAWNNARFKHTIVPHSMRMVVWMRDGVVAGQHPYFVDERVGGGRDVPPAKMQFRFADEIDSAVLFFARKFRTPDSELMRRIDERAQKQETVNTARRHLVRKVASREARIAEL